MSVASRLQSVGRRVLGISPKAEPDIDADLGVARSRDLGGVPDPTAVDQGSTTGTTPTESFVGRVAGQDVGYAEEQGSERRAEARRLAEES